MVTQIQDVVEKADKDAAGHCHMPKGTPKGGTYVPCDTPGAVSNETGKAPSKEEASPDKESKESASGKESEAPKESKGAEEEKKTKPRKTARANYDKMAKEHPRVGPTAQRLKIKSENPPTDFTATQITTLYDSLPGGYQSIAVIPNTLKNPYTPSNRAVIPWESEGIPRVVPDEHGKKYTGKELEKLKAEFPNLPPGGGPEKNRYKVREKGGSFNAPQSTRSERRILPDDNGKEYSKEELASLKEAFGKLPPGGGPKKNKYTIKEAADAFGAQPSAKGPKSKHKQNFPDFLTTPQGDIEEIDPEGRRPVKYAAMPLHPGMSLSEIRRVHEQNALNEELITKLEPKGKQQRRKFTEAQQLARDGFPDKLEVILNPLALTSLTPPSKINRGTGEASVSKRGNTNVVKDFLSMALTTARSGNAVLPSDPAKAEVWKGYMNQHPASSALTEAEYKKRRANASDGRNQLKGMSIESLDSVARTLSNLTKGGARKPFAIASSQPGAKGMMQVDVDPETRQYVINLPAHRYTPEGIRGSQAFQAEIRGKRHAEIEKLLGEIKGDDDRVEELKRKLSYKTDFVNSDNPDIDAFTSSRVASGIGQATYQGAASPNMTDALYKEFRKNADYMCKVTREDPEFRAAIGAMGGESSSKDNGTLFGELCAAYYHNSKPGRKEEDKIPMHSEVVRGLKNVWSDMVDFNQPATDKNIEEYKLKKGEEAVDEVEDAETKPAVEVPEPSSPTYKATDILREIVLLARAKGVKPSEDLMRILYNELVEEQNAEQDLQTKGKFDGVME